MWGSEEHISDIWLQLWLLRRLPSNLLTNACWTTIGDSLSNQFKPIRTLQCVIKLIESILKNTNHQSVVWDNCAILIKKLLSYQHWRFITQCNASQLLVRRGYFCGYHIIKNMKQSRLRHHHNPASLVSWVQPGPDSR